MSLKMLLKELKGGPWIEANGKQEGNATRFEFPETITVTGNQRLETVYEYRVDGTRTMKVRRMPLILALWEDFRWWLAGRIEP